MRAKRVTVGVDPVEHDRGDREYHAGRREFSLRQNVMDQAAVETPVAVLERMDVNEPERRRRRLIFTGLRQQHHELVAAVAERKVNQPQLRFDQVSDFGQQPATYQMSMRIVDLLEVVKVNKDDAEL